MAQIPVASLLGMLSSSAIDEMQLFGRAERDVKEIKAELDSMLSFLQDADTRAEREVVEEIKAWMKTWVEQVREVAYEAEDILDEYYLRLVQPCNQGIFSSFLNCLEYCNQLKTRHFLATEMQHIKTRITAISERREKYAFSETPEGSGSVHTSTTLVQWHDDPRIASLYIGEAEVVGIDAPKNILIEWLKEEKELTLTIISVVGMGGLGKTTLVKKVYDSQMVKEHFKCHVWITVSKSPIIRELLLTTIKEVLKETNQQAPEGMDAMEVDHLRQVLINQLSGKRYVIIFDDIWDINVWEAIKFAFPNCDCGSRIIFTTRTSKVAACSSYVHYLEPLNEEEAWKLFCMKAFGSNHDDNNSGCPEELKELSRKILKKCGGLPLAIVLIGGLLKKKDALEWNMIHDSLGAEMRNDDKLKSLTRILLLSYNNLPYYLKPCFLYLSMFPEDYFIKRMTLIRLWIAEGFVGKEQGKTMEVVAGNYVNELISRSLIQIAELTRCNEVKSVRIHDLMREIFQPKSKEEYFSTTIIGSQGMGDGLLEKARRISIYHNSTGDQNYGDPMDSSRCSHILSLAMFHLGYPMDSRCSHIRSLTMFQLDESPALSFGDKFFRAFRLLKVLDLERASLAIFPPELVELIHLRYLSLRSTKIAVLPKSVGELKNLETLDLKQTNVSELPVEILKLQRLRHLLVYRTHFDTSNATYGNFDTSNTYTYGVSVPTGIGNLISLQKLAFLDVQQQAARDGGDTVVLKELGKLTQLTRLGITNLRDGDGKDLCLALEKMKHLSTLKILISTKPPNVLELQSLISPPQYLRHLALQGHLKRLPVWIASLRYLTSLSLGFCRLSSEEDDPLKAFQHMASLIFLELNAAYHGEELCCNEVGGYKNLKKLHLVDMEGLKRVRFMQGSMPMLIELHIALCPALEMVPHGIEHLKGLQELMLWEMKRGLMERIGGETSEDIWRVQHIPKVYHIYDNHEGTIIQLRYMYK